MKVDKQVDIVLKEIEKLLLSGHNYSIFIDIKRSQVTYFKYVANRDMVKLNVKTGAWDGKTTGKTHDR